MDIKELSKPFPRECISWRVGATNKEKTSAIALAYIDARDVMQRLDEVCGPQHWQALYPHANGKTSCKIGIHAYAAGSPDEGWVWKENGAGDSDVEADKGAFSDAFKRAAVLWGVGRYLYDVPNVWVDIVPYGKSYKIKNPNDPKLWKALEQAEKGIRVIETPEEPVSDKSTQAELLTKVAMAKDKHEMQSVIDEIQSQLLALPAHMQELINQEIENRLNGFEKGVSFPPAKHKFDGVNDAAAWLRQMKPAVEGIKSSKVVLDWQKNNQPWIDGLEILSAEKYKRNGKSPKEIFTDLLKTKYEELSALELSQRPLAAE